MTEYSLKKIFTHSGSYTHKGPVESGSTIIVQSGNCMIEGPVGDDVSLQVDQNGDVTSLGEAITGRLGYGSTLRGARKTGVTNDETKCGEYKIAIRDGFIHITRNWPSAEGDSNSCCNIDFKPPSPAQ